MKRTLSLKREALTPLTTDELSQLHAAGPDTDGCPQPTPPVYFTVGRPCTESIVFC
jgi:hypothetical protein